MAESDRDDEIGRRYRELAREEPPRELDEAILAAARGELETRPAPLVAPSGRRRWMFPVAAAAVIVLSAVITLQIQREQPDLELASAPPPPAPPAPSNEAQAGARSQTAPQAEPPAAPAKRKDAEGEKELRRAQPRREERPALARTPASPPAQQAAPLASTAPAPSAQPPALADSVQPKPAEEKERLATERDAAAGAQALSRRAELSAKRADSAESPERMLERIAALRREGRQKEADELYAEFRRRFPDYRIPEAMREQILPR